MNTDTIKVEVRKDQTLVTYGEVCRNMTWWANELNIERTTLLARLRNWGVTERVLSPKKEHRRTIYPHRTNPNLAIDLTLD